MLNRKKKRSWRFEATPASPPTEELLLLPYADARKHLADSEISVTVLAPPYRCAGRGTLRVVRVAEPCGAQTKSADLSGVRTKSAESASEARREIVNLVLTYDDYVRI